MADSVASLLKEIESPIGTLEKTPCRWCGGRGEFVYQKGEKIIRRDQCIQCNGRRYVYKAPASEDDRGKAPE